MSGQKIVQLAAAATVNPRDWEAFLSLLKETKAVVRREGDRVLIHECYYDPAKFRCWIMESYIDEQAFLSHLELIRPLSERYRVDWKIERLELLGAFSPSVIAAMEQSGDGTVVTHYGDLFKSR